MANDASNLSGKVGLDVTDFKSGISTLNREIRVIESGFRATAAGLGDWAKSATGLEARMKALTSQIDLQQKKVGALEAEYKRVAAEKGETSRAAQDLQIRLNKETETLNKMQGELNQTEKALSEMGDESKDAGKGAKDLAGAEDRATTATGRLKASLAQLNDRLQRTVSGFRNLGTKILKGVALGLAGIGVAAVGAAVGLGRVVTSAAKAADEIAENAEKIGISTDKYQEFSFIGEQIGTDVETIGRSFARLTKNVAAADKAGSPAAKAFEALGVSTRDAGGALRDSEAVFSDVIDALGKIDNETQRDILAQQLFGKSFQELNPLINLGADGLARMTDEAHKAGAVMSTETVQGLADLNDRLAAMRGRFKVLLGQLASKFLPVINKVFDAFQKWLDSPAVQKGIKSITDQIGNFADTLGRIIDKLLAGDVAGALKEFIPAGVVNQIVSFAKTFNDFIQNTLLPFVREHAEEIKGALIGIGVALAAAGIVALIAGIGGAIAALLNPVGLIIAAAALIGAAWKGNWLGIRDTLTQFWETTGRPIFEQLRAWLGENIPIAIQALKNFWDTVLLPAFQTFGAFLQEKVFPVIQQLIAWLAENIPAAIQTLSGFWTGTLQPALEAVWNFLKTDVFPLFEALNELFNVAATLAVTALAGLWQNVLQPALSAVWAFIQDKVIPIISDLIDWLEDKLGPPLAWLADVVLAGLVSAFEAVRDAVQWVIDRINDLITALKNLDLPDWLKPGSPTPLELGLRGISKAIDELNRKQLPEMNMNLRSSAAAGAGAGQPAAAPISITIQATVSREMDWHFVARKVLEEVDRARS